MSRERTRRLFALKRMQIRNQLAHLLVAEAIPYRRHHPAPVYNRLRDEPVIRGQSAWQVFFPVQFVQPRPMQAARRVRVMATRAALVENCASRGLFCVQSKLRVRFERAIRPVSCNKQRRDQNAQGQNRPAEAHRNSRMHSQRICTFGAAAAARLDSASLA
jgi:hypothetical protein